MIDLHAHILPGIDDGPQSLEGSLALARAAVECGTHLVIATPHLRDDHPGVRLEEIGDRTRALGAALAREDIPLRVLPGAEVDLLWASNASEAELRMATYGQLGTDMLLETPYGNLPPNFNELVLRIAEQGIRILLAHPERSSTFQQHPQRLLELVARGVLVQVTALSLARKNRRSESRRLARWLLEEGAAHVIASDAHAAGLWRGPDRAAAIASAEAISPAHAEWMLLEVPRAIIAGEPVPPMPSRGRGPLKRLSKGLALRRALDVRLG